MPQLPESITASTAEWNTVRATAATNSRPGGLKGTDVIKALQAGRNWQAVFWAPDPRDPSDGKPEHPFAYRKVRDHGTYYGIAVDQARSVINYRRTQATHGADLNGIEKLRRLQFGLLAAARRNASGNDRQWRRSRSALDNASYVA